MPLIKGKQNIGKNISELVNSKPSRSRRKAIETYARNHNVSYEVAKQKMAVIIALNNK